MTFLRTILIVAAVGLGLGARAEERTFSYAPEGATAKIWGTGRAEAYDVAIFVPQGALGEGRARTVRVPILTTANMSQMSVWVSKSLDSLEYVVETRVAESGALGTPELVADFPAEFAPGSEGYYVGYSFNIDKTSSNLQKSPVVVADGTAANGLIVRTSDTYPQWTPLAASLSRVSMMSLEVEGQFGQYNVAVGDLAPVFTTPGAASTVHATLYNHGLSAVKSLNYSYSIGGKSAEGQLTLATPLPAQFGSQTTVEFPFRAPEEEGAYELKLSVVSLDGEPNGSPNKASAGTATVLDRLPVCRPLMEEYTGLWCGWCPSGYVAMEMMKELHPEDFVCVSYHNNDELDAIAPYPSQVSAYPAAYMNRTLAVNPWYGLSDSKEFGIEDVWQELHSQFSPADIAVEVAWADNDHKQLQATAHVTFIGDQADADYRLSYVLLGDGLSSPDWVQNNSYSGNTKYSGKYWDIFTKGNRAILGLVYNDIALKYEYYEGIPGSLPSEIKAFEPLSHSYSFDLTTVNTIDGSAIPYDPAKLHVVAMLFDGKTGRMVNCADSPYPAVSGVEDAEAEEIVAVEYYDLQGRPMAGPAKGAPYIEVSTGADGRPRRLVRN